MLCFLPVLIRPVKAGNEKMVNG